MTATGWPEPSRHRAILLPALLICACGGTTVDDRQTASAAGAGGSAAGGAGGVAAGGSAGTHAVDAGGSEPRTEGCAVGHWEPAVELLEYPSPVTGLDLQFATSTSGYAVVAASRFLETTMVVRGSSRTGVWQPPRSRPPGTRIAATTSASLVVEPADGEYAVWPQDGRESPPTFRLATGPEPDDLIVIPSGDAALLVWRDQVVPSAAVIDFATQAVEGPAALSGETSGPLVAAFDAARGRGVVSFGGNVEVNGESGIVEIGYQADSGFSLASFGAVGGYMSFYDLSIAMDAEDRAVLVREGDPFVIDAIRPSRSTEPARLSGGLICNAAPQLVTLESGELLVAWSNAGAALGCVNEEPFGLWSSTLTVASDSWTRAAHFREPELWVATDTLRLAPRPSGGAVAAWREHRVLSDERGGVFAAFFDAGSGWSAAEPIGQLDVNDEPTEIALEVDGLGNITVAWASQSAGVRAARFDAASSAWMAEELLDGPDLPMTPAGPLLGVDGYGNAIAVWAVEQRVLVSRFACEG